MAQDIYAYCLRRTTTTDEAMDAATDVFVVAWGRFNVVAKGEDALPWLYCVDRIIQ
jgi:DNA-directed RNA polymerase specialized sigma24 family protein